MFIGIRISTAMIIRSGSLISNPAVPATPANAYVAEDGSTNYVAEDGSTYYTKES